MEFTTTIRERIDNFLKNDPNSEHHNAFAVVMEFNPTDDDDYILSFSIKAATSIYGDNEIIIYQHDKKINKNEITKYSKEIGDKIINAINFANNYFNTVSYFQFELSPLGLILYNSLNDESFNDIEVFNAVVKDFVKDNWCYGGILTSIVGF